MTSGDQLQLLITGLVTTGSILLLVNSILLILGSRKKNWNRKIITRSILYSFLSPIVGGIIGMTSSDNLFEAIGFTVVGLLIGMAISQIVIFVVLVILSLNKNQNEVDP